ncbi:MAG: 3-dehydroquinate synthase family protein [Spirochaetaceae bacterium]
MKRTFDLGRYSTACSTQASGIADALLELEDRGEVLTVYDEHTAELFAPPGRGDIVLPAGEHAKEWSSVELIIDEALKRELGRDAVFVGVGGGVVTDVTAFAASVYLRGVELELLPTTLLAMVDAAFGGKTGVNYGGYKNMVGTFYPASSLRIYIECLNSLSEREFMSGLAEVIKAALLGDEELLSFLHDERERVLARIPEAMEYIVDRAIGVKAHVVEQDLLETGVRAILNLGHTFAHALESVAGFGRWSHGAAVAWGIARALETGERLGLTPGEYADSVRSLIESYGYDTGATGEDVDALLSAMRRDKKRRGGRLNLVLQEGIGWTNVQEAPEALVREVLEAVE